MLGSPHSSIVLLLADRHGEEPLSRLPITTKTRMCEIRG